MNLRPGTPPPILLLPAKAANLRLASLNRARVWSRPIANQRFVQLAIRLNEASAFGCASPDDPDSNQLISAGPLRVNGEIIDACSQERSSSP